MRKLTVKKLDREAFRPYGDFVSLLRPAEFYGDAPSVFTPDMLQLPLAQHDLASFSICRVAQRPNIVDTSEYHSAAWEGNIPLDGDIVLHMAPANNGKIDADKFEAFLVPKGTLVILKPGVWHYAPYAVKGEVSTLVVLPERTYANDCVVVKHAEDEKFEIEM
ncbi:MAG: DUF4867 family protein [Candidatus Spyradocola sp.]|jgi:ureidoglycolate lyase